MLPSRRTRVLEPVDQPAPVARVEEHDREVADLLGLAQRRGLERLVERPEPAREDDEPARVADEHDLPREEVVEGQRRRRRTRSATARAGARCRARPRSPPPPARAAVGGLHDPRAAAGDDRVALLAQLAAPACGRPRSADGRAACGRSRRSRPPCRRARARGSPRAARPGCAAGAAHPCTRRGPRWSPPRAAPRRRRSGAAGDAGGWVNTSNCRAPQRALRPPRPHPLPGEGAAQQQQPEADQRADAGTATSSDARS